MKKRNQVNYYYYDYSIIMINSIKYLFGVIY